MAAVRHRPATSRSLITPATWPAWCSTWESGGRTSWGTHTVDWWLHPAVEDLHRRMSAGLARYRDGDREGAVEAFLGATFGPGYRQQLEQVLPGWWDQAVRTADGFFGGEVPELPSWEFGLSQARRIAAPALSVRGSSSDPAFTAFERLLRDWFPRLETAEIAGADHRLHLQDPQPVAAALAEFFTRHPLE